MLPPRVPGVSVAHTHPDRAAGHGPNPPANAAPHPDAVPVADAVPAGEHAGGGAGDAVPDLDLPPEPLTHADARADPEAEPHPEPLRDRLPG